MGLFHIVIPLKRFGNLADYKFKILSDNFMCLLNKLTQSQDTFVIIIIPSMSILFYTVKNAFR